MGEPEARGIRIALRDATRHFDVRASEKVTDCLMLASVLGFAYGPRVLLTVKTLRERQGAQPPPGNGYDPFAAPAPPEPIAEVVPMH